MKIAVIGATGNIGQPVMQEALSRGHTIVATTRDASKIEPSPNVTVAQLNTQHTHDIAEAVRGADAAVISVKWNENSIHDLIEGIRRSGVGHVIFVVGAGSLTREDGRLHFEHMQDLGITPPTSKPAMDALDVLRGVTDIHWSAISPPFDIHPGERTGQFVIGGDEMLRPTAGHPIARISRQDFAVAILDELENPEHLRKRFTVAN